MNSQIQMSSLVALNQKVDAVRRLVERLLTKVDIIMGTQAELAADLLAVKDKVAKIGLETSATLDKVAELEAALAAAGGVGGIVTPELQAAVDALKAQVQLVDDLVPDTTGPTP